MGRAKPDVRPPGAAIPSAKSISIAEIPLGAMAVGLQPYSERWLAGGAPHWSLRRAAGQLPAKKACQKATQYERYKHRRRRPLDGRRRGAPHTSCYLWAWPYVQTAKFWREKWDFLQSRM